MRIVTLLGAAAAVTAAQADIMEGERGVKFMNERLTLSPYVALSYTYDSNIDSGKKSQSGSQWVINPGINFEYNGGHWNIDGMVFYRYHAYNRYTSQLNESSFGERLKFNWTNADVGEPGWSAQFSESFEQIAQDDDMSGRDGRGLGRDRKQFQGDAMLSRRMNEHWHAGVEASYYLLDYDNDMKKYAPMYGWKRVTAGGQAGYTLSQWSDILLSANYQWYDQDNDRNRDEKFRREEASSRGRRISSNSKGWSVMGGLQSQATEKLKYKVLTGWSHFEYGSGTKDCDGWTYTVSGDWQVDAENTLQIMVLGSSYYQPSEREYGSAIKVYNLSCGARKSLVHNKLHATVDLAYRKETHEYTEYAEDDYDEDIWTARIGLTYDINRLFSIYGRIEYQVEETEGGGARGHDYDYDRWRGTVGVRMTY